MKKPTLKPKFLPTLIACVLCLSASAAATSPSVYNIRDYGATGDGVTLDTAAFAKAVDAAFRAGGGTVLVPPGRYHTGSIRLKSHVTLNVEGGAVILGSGEPGDYPLTEDIWSEDTKPSKLASLIYAEDSENITITGRGTIDGQGQVWWQRVRYANPDKYKLPPLTDHQRAEVAKLAHSRPRLVRMVRCRDMLIENVNLVNSAEWTVNPQLCDHVRIENITPFSNISARGAKNAGEIIGLREMPIEDIVFNNVRIHAAKGFTTTNARDITFLNTIIDTDSGSALTLRNTSEIDTAGFRTRKPHKDTPLVAR